MFQETASKAEKATRAEGLRVRRAGRALQLATRRAGQSRSGRVVGRGMEASGGLLPGSSLRVSTQQESPLRPRSKENVPRNHAEMLSRRSTGASYTLVTGQELPELLLYF